MCTRINGTTPITHVPTTIIHTGSNRTNTTQSHKQCTQVNYFHARTRGDTTKATARNVWVVRRPRNQATDWVKFHSDRGVHTTTTNHYVHRNARVSPLKKRVKLYRHHNRMRTVYENENGWSHYTFVLTRLNLNQKLSANNNRIRIHTYGVHRRFQYHKHRYTRHTYTHQRTQVNHIKLNLPSIGTCARLEGACLALCVCVCDAHVSHTGARSDSPPCAKGDPLHGVSICYLNKKCVLYTHCTHM